MSVEFKDFSFDVKAAINDTTMNWLRTWSNEIASEAKRNVKLDDEAGIQLRGNYRADVDEMNGVAYVGSTLESAYWEEYGTGAYADMSKNGGQQGRQGWWIYIKGKPRTTGGQMYDEAEAKAVAAGLREQGIDAYATNGRQPNYTLENAFTTVKPKAIRDLESKLKGALD